MKLPTRFLYIILATIFIAGYGAKNVAAQTSPSVLYIPLIGISAVPQPLALPKGPGNIIYYYAVKNFLKETPLTNVLVSDDKCSPVKFTGGDDNNDSKLDYSEVWRYECVTKLSETTQSVATVIGTANNLTASHKAYSTVIVGSNDEPPLVNIINITKVAYPLTLPVGGGDITFTYRVNNPGVVPLSNVTVIDDKCGAVSSKLGDTNGDGLLNINEVWTYTCKAHLSQTTTNTAEVTAFANGLKAVGYATITVTVDIPSLPNTGTVIDFKTIIWGILSVILVALIIFFILTKKR